MIGEKRLKEIADKALTLSKAKETEVLIIASSLGLTRFANNEIHQNVEVDEAEISIRVVVGKKVGVAGGNIQIKSHSSKLEDYKPLKDIIDKALEIAKASNKDPDFPGLPKVAQGTKDKAKNLKSIYKSTINFSPKNRAEAVAIIIKQAEKNRLTAFGSLQNGFTEYVIANSHGVFGYHPVSNAYLNIRMMKGERSGYSGFISTNISDIDFDRLAKEAVMKTTFGNEISDLEPGDYEVILEEPAVSEMMQFLSYLGFGAKQFHEGSSFVSGKLNEKVLGENVNIFDDPFHAQTIPIPFDFEGMPKKKMVLVENGVVKNIAYDNYYGKRYGKKPTGHALPAPNSEGPFPFHLTLSPGKTPRAELIKGVRYGILVTRFWYVNPIHPKILNITGMTRDGTFLIKNGKIVGALRNLRFTQSIPEALSNVINIAKEVKAEEGIVGANIVPALHIGKFHFTGESRL